MALIELKMPKMGESVIEATIISWYKTVGDVVAEDENIVEVATDKVDAEVPSTASGVITQILFNPDEVVSVGEVIAIIDSEGSKGSSEVKKTDTKPELQEVANAEVTTVTKTTIDSNRFYSPLIKRIAAEAGLSSDELNNIVGNGIEGRLRKSDLYKHLDSRIAQPNTQSTSKPIKQTKSPVILSGPNDQIIEMDRMRRMIADHMVNSIQTSPHVTTFIEADVTDLVNWRNKVKKDFQKKYNQKLTFTPLFIEAVTKAILDFPMINVSVDGNNIILHKNIHVGMAAALPNGNLIVPVVKHADQKSLAGIATDVNEMAVKARENKLKPDDIQGSTFTLSNVGTFGALMGTPIINQPEVAILATGIIKKRAEVIETQQGDVIAIRQMMYLSLSFDHRVVDGYLGGSFLRRIGDYLEQFDANRTI